MFANACLRDRNPEGQSGSDLDAEAAIAKAAIRQSGSDRNSKINASRATRKSPRSHVLVSGLFAHDNGFEGGYN
jgi:hypothetical protein